jgi:hypothetical protein
LPKPWATQPPPGTGIVVAEPPEGVNDHIPATEVTVSPAATGGAGQPASAPLSSAGPSATAPSRLSPEEEPLPDDDPPSDDDPAVPEELSVEPATPPEELLLLVWLFTLEVPVPEELPVEPASPPDEPLSAWLLLGAPF